MVSEELIVFCEIDNIDIVMIDGLFGYVVYLYNSDIEMLMDNYEVSEDDMFVDVLFVIVNVVFDNEDN